MGSNPRQTTIIHIQDILALGSSARMNIPATQLNSGDMDFSRKTKARVLRFKFKIMMRIHHSCVEPIYSATILYIIHISDVDQRSDLLSRSVVNGFIRFHV